MVKAGKKIKKQHSFNVSWKKILIGLSVSLNIIFAGSVVASYIYYNSDSSAELSYAVMAEAHYFSCERHGDYYLGEVRSHQKNSRINDEGMSVLLAIQCQRDYKTGNSVDFSAKTYDSIYRDVLKARNE